MKQSRLIALLLGLGCLLWWTFPQRGAGKTHAPPGLLPVSLPVPLLQVASPSAPAFKTTELVEVEVKDVIPLEEAQTHAVMLVSQEGTVLPIFVEESAAVAIAFRLAHREAPHALAEDLLDELVKHMGGKVTQVQVDDVQNHQARSRIIIRQGKQTHELQARASDSIAVALSSGAKIFVTKRLVEAAGITREEIETLREQLGVGGSGDMEPPPPAPEDGNEIRL